MSYNFEVLVVDEVVLVVLWSGHEAFDKKGHIRDGPVWDHKALIDDLARYMQRHATMEALHSHRSGKSTILRALVLDSTRSTRRSSTRGFNKRDHMHFDAPGATVYALSQKMYEVVKWTCTALIVRVEVRSWHVGGNSSDE